MATVERVVDDNLVSTPELDMWAADASVADVFMIDQVIDRNHMKHNPHGSAFLPLPHVAHLD